MRFSGSRWHVVWAGVLVLASVVPASAEWSKGVEAYNSKDYATAVKEFEQVTQTNPAYAGAYYMMGLAQNGQGKPSQALASLRKAVELDDANVSYKVALGQTLIQAKQYQEAYSILKPLSISSMESKYRTSYALLFAQSATKTGRAGEAVSVLDTQVRADGSNPRLYQAMGGAQSASGDDRKAYEAYKKAFDLDSKDQASGRNAAKAALSVARRSSSDSTKRTNYSDAAAVAERLAALADTPEHVLLAGEAWLGAKQYDKALSWFEKAKAKQPKSALVRFYSGQCYSSLGKLDSSINALQEALKLGPTGKLRDQVYETLGYVYDKQKNYDKAIEVYRIVGNSSKIQEIEGKKSQQEKNLQADQERKNFRAQVEALRHQIQELDKLGQSEDVAVLRAQLADLEKALGELK